MERAVVSRRSKASTRTTIAMSVTAPTRKDAEAGKAAEAARTTTTTVAARIVTIGIMRQMAVDVWER